MKILRPVALFLFAATLAASFAAPRAHAFSCPVFDVSAGQTMAANGKPGDGGLSLALAPMWRAGSRARFGFAVFVDDIGSDVSERFDVHDGQSIGVLGGLHRWAWGGAWRSDCDVLRRKHWSGSLSASLGWTRIEDDMQGHYTNYVSAVGTGLGAGVRRIVNDRHEVGLTARWNALTSDRKAAYRRVDHYATVSIDYRWTGPSRP